MTTKCKVQSGERLFAWLHQGAALLACILFTVCATEAQAVTYLKADAVGNNDGSSWDNAYTNVAAAVSAAASGDNIVYAAQGVYIISATITPADGLAIYGGFPGVSMDETIDDRNPDIYQTIFTGDQALDDVWEHVMPNLGQYSATYTKLSDKVIDGGKVNLPGTFSGDYDGYWPSIVGANTARGFTIDANVGVIFDGLWFTGFQGSEGTCIWLLANAKSSTIHDCRFVGNYPNNGTICDKASSVDTYITHCQFLFNCTGLRGSGLSAFGRTRVNHCTFVSCSRSLNNGGNVIFFWQGSNNQVDNSSFARCFELADREWGEVNYGGSGNIVAAEGGNGSFTDCVFTNNLSMSQFTYGSPLFSIRTGFMRNCLIAHNRYEVKPRAGRSYGLLGNTQTEHSLLLDGNTFVSNTIAAPQVEATAGSYALGIVGHGLNSVRQAVINCTFVDNHAEAAPVAGVTPILSRALLTTANSYNSSAQLGVVNCTFSSSVDDGLYDLVQYGPYHSYPLTLLNSLFTGAAAEYTPIYSDKPELLLLRDTTIKGLHFPPAWLNQSGLEVDEPALAPLAPLPPGTLPVRQVAATMPGIRTTADIATNQPATFPPLFRYRLRDTATWVPLLNAVNGGLDGSTPLPIRDACQLERAFGTFTRGAVQPLTVAAANGVSLILRADPPGSGSFSAPGAVQVVATNATITPITATPASGATFLGWYAADESLYSDNPTLEIAALAEDTVLTARFATESVALTFDLGTGGTFNDNSAATITLNLPAGTPFPALPAFAADSAWHLDGWSPPLPSAVPQAHTTYTAQLVSTALRIIHVVPPAEVPETSDGSGSSWANARSDIAGAAAEAARYRGEVWFKGGRYLLTEPHPLYANVTLRGGFAGHEVSAAAADPELHPTIISGDVNNDNYWQPNYADPGVAYRTNIWNGLTFNHPTPGNDVNCWAPSGNAGDDTQIGFSDAKGTITNAAFDGLTLTCFRQTALAIKSGSHLKLSRCKIYACNSSRGNYNSAIEAAGQFQMEHSALIGNWRAINLTGAALTTTNSIHASYFAENSATSYSSSLHSAATTPLLVTACHFYRNSGLSEGFRNSASITLSTAGINWIRECLFEENRVRNNCHGNLIMEGNGTLVVERCTFRRNNLISSADRAHHSAALMVMSGNVLVRDSYFTGNSCNVEQTSSDNRAWGAVYCGTGGWTTFLNTTFSGNSATASGGGNHFCGTFASNGASPHLALVHCTVADSLLGEGCYEFNNVGANLNTTLALINTVVHSSVPSYAAFNLPEAVTLCLASSSITGLAPETLAIGNNGYLYDLFPGDPVLAQHLTPITATASARGVSALSPVARAGRPVWLADDGYLYIYDPLGKGAGTPWRRVVSKQTGGYATVADISLETPPVPDALGALRRDGYLAFGPLNAPPAGTLILLR